MMILWTDGSASPNPGPGGWAVIDANTRQPVCLGRDPATTNIRMEGTALTAAIRFASSSGCEIHTDSEFWINVLTKWADTWAANHWHKKRGKIQNLDLVQELYSLYHQFPVQLVWEKGHAGTDLNELADLWANRARTGATLSPQ